MRTNSNNRSRRFKRLAKVGGRAVWRDGIHDKIVKRHKARTASQNQTLADAEMS